MSSMRAALKQLSSESLVYGLGQVSGRAVQLLLVPVLTRVLMQAEYGVSDLVFAYLQTAVLVLVFGMDGALARFFYQEPDREARIRMASSSLVFRLAVGDAPPRCCWRCSPRRSPARWSARRPTASTSSSAPPRCRSRWSCCSATTCCASPSSRGSSSP